MSRQAKLPTTPVQARITVPGDSDRAFEIFTQAISEWWPLETHSVFGKDSASCVFEAREGGRIYERASDGRESVWGKVTHCNSPSELRFKWHPGRAESTAQEITVRFSSMMFGTKVELEHGDWEPLGDQAREVKSRYERDWPSVLERYAQRAAKTG
jgi:hypothetical protein